MTGTTMTGTTMTSTTILLADDDAAIRTVLAQYLQQQGYSVRATQSGVTLWSWVQAGLGDLVVCDVIMPDADGLDLLPKIRGKRPELPVIIMSAKNTVLTALRASECGAFDYLPKPFDLQHLLDAIQKALAKRELVLPQAGPDMELPIVGSSPVMQSVYRLIAKMAPTALTVMIRGESGTGKELVAKVLHDFGPRRTKPFVALNMAAIPTDLVESELFGHERGAFTGADAKKDGRFAQAAGGTLFLDEIGDMPLSTQTRLLRVLQEGTYTRVGGLKEQRTDVRIIAATHRDLDAMVAAGSFREDLFYRLNVVPIDLPPLRDRLADLPELVPVLVQGLASASMPVKYFTQEAYEAMARYPWPGNVRELENFLQRLLAVLPQAVVDAAAVIEALPALKEKPQGEGQGSQVYSVKEVQEFAIEPWIAAFFQENRHGVPVGKVYAHFLALLERPLIEQALRQTKGSQIQAAALLGLNRNTLRKKVQDLGIRVVRGHGAARDRTGP